MYIFSAKRLSSIKFVSESSEAALYSCSYKKMLGKYAANLQENTHAEV